jgi:AcrR family transcriptional regulator
MAQRPASDKSTQAAPDNDATATRILDSALAEFADYGIRRVSVDDIAVRAGVHRTTVYRYFPNKAAIIQAAGLKWVHDTFSRINEEVQGLPFGERLVEGFSRAVSTLQDDPLATKVLGPDGDAALRALTVDGGPVIGMVTAMFVHWLWDTNAAPPEDAAKRTEIFVRLGLSFALTPDSNFDMRSPKGRKEFARTYMLPIVTGR